MQSIKTIWASHLDASYLQRKPLNTSLYKNALMGLVFLTCSLIISLPVNSIDEQKIKTDLSQTEFLGLKLAEADINTVRSHLWDIGGFLQAKTTMRQRNVDKFYPWSTIRDSYYVLFEYNHAGKVVTVTRLFRPYSTELTNSREAISTREVALQLMENLGQPTTIQRKSWAGTPSYLSYVWQDDNMKVVVDREGSEYLGNVFIKYTLKNNPRYEVVKDDETGV